MVAGLYLSINAAWAYSVSGLQVAASMFILAPRPDALLHSVDAYVAAALMALTGRALNSWISGESCWKYLVGAIFAAFSRQVFVELGLLLLEQGSVLLLFYWIALTILIPASLTVIFLIRERLQRLHRH